MLSYKVRLSSGFVRVTYGSGLEKSMARAKAERLERALWALPQVDCPIRERFEQGVYIREMTIPAGVAVVGAVHKVDNVATLSKGRLILATERGPLELCAPHVIAIKAGTKNAVAALEESVWTNRFPNPTNETDIDKLVELISESKASDLIGGATNKQLAANAAQLENLP